MWRFTKVLTPVVVLLAAAACDREPDMITSDPFDRPTAFPNAELSSERASAIRARLPEGPLTHDDLFRAAAELDPWFAGLYVEDGRIYVLSTDPGVDREELEAAVAAVLEMAGRQNLASRIQEARVVEARYWFVELADWLDRLLPIVRHYGVHGIGINERANVIDFTTATSAGASGLGLRVALEAIPADAVRIRTGERSRFNHYIGGAAVDVGQWGILNPKQCSLMQVVERRFAEGGGSHTYAITASHCTIDFAVTSGSTFVVDGSDIADEIWDHPFITNPQCESLTGSSEPKCRQSDAALFEYRSSWGGIWTQLKPHKVAPGWELELESEEMLLFQGEIVNKYGRTTGLTYGEITATCTNPEFPFPKHGFYFLCQYEAAYHSQDGDSGGPVWVREPAHSPFFAPEDPGYSEDVRRFVGIHSVRTGHGTGQFSRAAGIAQEIVPDEPNWGTICLSLNSAFCTY